MTGRPHRHPLVAALALAALSGGCAEECYVFPTRVELEVEPEWVDAPGEVLAVAQTELGSATCGPDPTAVVAYHWRLDDVPLEGEDGEPLADTIVVELEEPGVHVLEVRIEDDLGRELPDVGRSSIFAY